MKTILHIVEPFASGVFMFVVNLANEQAKKNNVIIAHGLRPLTHENYTSFFDPRIKLIRVENFSMNINLNSNYKAVGEIKSIIKDNKPDVIHMHSSFSGVIGRIAALGSGINQIYSPHGFSFLKQDDSLLKRMIYKSIEWFCSKFPNVKIVASSQGEYIEAKKISKSATLINNGIRTNDLDTYLTNYEENKKFTVCTVGRILEQKNPILFNKIALKMPDVRFIWVGEGDLRNELSAPNIEITGWGPREEALEIVATSDVYIMTSLWEGMPLSLMEAMYMKKACVVSNVLGNRDLISNEQNGYVCDTVDDFVKCISTLKENKSRADEYGMLARKDIENKYTIKIMENQYQQIYYK